MSRTYLFLRWFFLITLIEGFALANQASAADCPRKHSYAVYLSPGYEPGVRWGGYHVTITKFSKSHVCKRKGGMKTALHDVWKKPYSFKSKKEGEDYWGEASGGIYGVVFKSDLLTHKLKPELRKQGFEGVKSHWHISLYSDSEAHAVEKFETTRLKEEPLKEEPWHLFIVRKPGRACQNHGTHCPRDYWEAID